MVGITLEQAQAKLEAYLAAETAVLSGQSYQIGGRTLTRANLFHIREGIETWDARVKQFDRSARGRTRARTMIVGG
jgi:hypothetical protein